MNKGTVKWFNSKRGIGFITMENGEDIFVHYSGIIGGGFKKLNDGDNVVFEIESNEKGKFAVDIVVENIAK